MKLPEIRLPRRLWPDQLWMRLGVILVAVAVVAAVTAAGVRQITGLPEDAAFEYRDDVVTQAELEERVDALEALYGIKEPTGGTAQDTFRRDVAKAVAVSMILDQAAAEHDIVISDKSARDTLSAMVEDQLGTDPQTAFTEMLGEFGVTEDDVLEEIKRQQAIARLFQEVTKDAVEEVSPEEIRAYFDEDPDRFATPEQRKLRNIVVASREDAVAVLTRTRKGEDFGGLAQRTSLDDATRAQKGLLGTVTAAQLDPGFAQVAFATRQGSVFGPVQTSFGWNVGQVLGIVPGQEAVFTTVEDQVTDAVRSERALATWRDWLAAEIEEADVVYADQYRPANPDEPPADSGVGQGPVASGSGEDQ